MGVAIPAQIGGQPVYIIKENVTRSSGEEVTANNAMIAEVIGELLKSSLGPRGMEKMLVGTVGDITLSKSAVTVLSEANIEHPVGKLFVELAKAADKNVGDGTTSIAAFASALVMEGNELVKAGVHPNVVATGFDKASGVAVGSAKQLALKIRLDDDVALKRVARTVILPALGDETALPSLMDMAIEVTRSIAEKRGPKFFVDIDEVSIVKKVGGNLTDSRLIKGVLVEKEIQHPNMPKLAKDCKVALVDFSLEVKKTEVSTEIELGSPELLTVMKDEERESVLSKIAGAVQGGAKVLFCQKGVSDFVAQRLTKEGIMVISRAKRSDMERLAKVTGASIVNDPSDLHEDKLGAVKQVEEVSFGKDKVVIVEGVGTTALSILLRGSAEDLLDRYEKAVKRGISAIANLYEDPRIVLGGGASISEVSKAVDRAKIKQKGEMQMVYAAYAKALDSLVQALVTNCGLHKLRDTAKIRTLHHTKSGAAAGVDAFKKAIVDAKKAGLNDPYRVMEYWLKGATELACTIMKVDDIVLASKPKEKKE